MNPTLVILLLVPAIGAVVGALLPNARLAKSWALLVSFVTLFVAVVAGLQLRSMGPGQMLRFGGADVPSLTLQPGGFSFSLGMDAISFWLVLLTVLLQPLAIAASFVSIRERQKEYYAWMLALLVAMLGVFVARDLLLFYVFFELTLVPMFFIIGIWGGPERRYAAGKFFLFTFAGSVFTLAAAVYLGIKAGSFDIGRCVEFAQTVMTPAQRYWMLLGFLAGFAVKVPLFPVHTWLPLAHTEAPTAGSVILAGVLLKLGTYGLLRLAVPVGVVGADLHRVVYTGHLIPSADWFPFTITFAGVLTVLGTLCVIGIIYGALVAWVQKDIKKLVAYSSVSHLGFCVLGLAALNEIGVQGSILYMINHGLSTGAMFLVIGMIYDRYHTRDIDALSGLARRMPVMACFFVFFVLSSIGLPGLNGFVSEFLTTLGAFTSENFAAPRTGVALGALAAIGIILGAVYMLHMTARVIFGPLKVPEATHGHAADHGADDAIERHAVSVHAAGRRGGGGPGHAPDAAADETSLPVDLSGREIAILVPIAVAVVILGVYPKLLTDSMRPHVQQILGVAPTPAEPVVADGMSSDSLFPVLRGEGRGEGLMPSGVKVASHSTDAQPDDTGVHGPGPLSPEYRGEGVDSETRTDASR